MNDWRIVELGLSRPGFTLGPVSFEVAEGEATAIVGPNGAGKTTLLRLLAGLEAQTGGRIERGGIDLSDRPPEARGLGYIPPGLGLFPHRTVLGNVAYAGELRGERRDAGTTRRWLDRFGLGPLAARYPRTLSSGEQQRVAVARALSASPKLLLWDEPVAALDVETRHALHETLRTLREEERIPLVFVTHDPADAFGVADRFVRLERGRVLRAGPMGAFGQRPRTAFDARSSVSRTSPAVRSWRRVRGAFARWLRDRTGPGGVAFSARTLSLRANGGFEGTIERLEPRADATGVRLRSEGMDLWGELAPGPGGPTALGRGTPVRFDLEESALWPLDVTGEETTP